MLCYFLIMIIINLSIILDNENVNINDIDNNGNNLLMWAIECKSLLIIEKLIIMGANPYQK